MARRFFVTGVGAVLALAGCAGEGGDMARAPVAEGGQECFFRSQVSGFNSAGPRHIIVHTGPGERYEFETFGPCPDLDFSEAIGFEQVGPGMICSGLDVNLIVPSVIGPQKCPIRMIRKLEAGGRGGAKAAE